MKKFMTFLAALALSTGLSFAQDTKAKTTKAAPEKKEATQAPAKSKEADGKGEAVAGSHLKKDGTPDKRFKENKDAKPAPGPTKKDGTPDMRYKSNKGAEKKSTKK
jgi:hypothetical protein